MNERIKLLRTNLNLNQSEFANKIGIGQAGLSAIEKGIRSVTDRNVQLICSVFGVNENWLRNGEGDVFLNIPPEDEYMRAAAEISKAPDDEIIRQIIIEYWKLNPEGKKLLKEFIYNISQRIEKQA